MEKCSYFVCTNVWNIPVLRLFVFELRSCILYASVNIAKGRQLLWSPEEISCLINALLEIVDKHNNLETTTAIDHFFNMEKNATQVCKVSYIRYLYNNSLFDCAEG